MASGQFAVVYRQIHRLFGSGSVAGMSEGQLLDRFIVRRDDAAFEAIVARHGPMVLGVCRGLLQDPNDVDDAFQATFLVLVRKADALRHRELLGNWLYGVAHRVARRSRAETARRRAREAKGPEPSDPAGLDSDRIDLRPLIHEEVDRLPESYRAAVVLCYLEGRTHEEAARELGWPIGTVKGRLARAKDLLRGRLTRRGLAVPSTALVATLAREGRAAVSPALVESTVAASGVGALGTLGVAASAHALSLTEGVLRAMSIAKLKLTATLVVAAGILAGPGVSALRGQGAGQTVGRQNTPPQGGEFKVARDPFSASKLAVPPDFSAAVRLKLAEEALAELRKPNAKARSLPDYVQQINDWEQRERQARQELEGLDYNYNDAVRKLNGLRDAEARAKAAYESDGSLKVEYLNARFTRLAAEQNVADLPGMGGAMRPGGGMMGGMAAAEKKGIDARLSPRGMMGAMPGPGPVEGMTNKGEMGGGRPIVDASDLAVLFPGRRVQHVADIERNKAIDDLLEKVVPMHFASETPLEEILKYLKEKLKDGKGKSIPIYLDPIGLQSADKTPQSTITIDLDDLPVRTTLRLLLDQLSLGFRVRDGIVYIQDNSTIAEEDERESFIESGVKRFIDRGVLPPRKTRNEGMGGGFQ